jgi:hypothetical protein
MAVWPSSLKSRPPESEKFSFCCSQAGSYSAALRAFARFLSTASPTMAALCRLTNPVHIRGRSEYPETHTWIVHMTIEDARRRRRATVCLHRLSHNHFH